MSSTENFPVYISLVQLPETGFSWRGDLPLQRFKRLYQEQHENVKQNHDTANTDIFVDCQLLIKDNLYWLHIDAAAQVVQTCQRCLTSVTLPISVDVTLALLSDEEQVRLLAEDADYVLLHDMPMQTANKKLGDAVENLDIIALIEDELLLALPIAPMHDDCELAVDTVGEIIEEKDENPFAVLAGLKGKL